MPSRIINIILLLKRILCYQAVVYIQPVLYLHLYELVHAVQHVFTWSLEVDAGEQLLQGFIGPVGGMELQDVLVAGGEDRQVGGGIRQGVLTCVLA